MPDFLDFSSAFSGGVAIEMILFVAIIAISGFLLYAYIYFSGSKWILRWYGAQKAQKSEKPVLHSLLKGLSSRAEVNPPRGIHF